jgi:hypothetical protein
MIDGRVPGTWLVVPKDADVAELAARLAAGQVPAARNQT